MLNKIKKYLGVAIICSIMFQVTVPVGVCSDVAKIKEKIKQNERNINDLKQKKAKQYKNQKNLNSQIKIVATEMKALSNEIKKIKNQTNNSQNKITKLVQQCARLQGETKEIDSQIKQCERDSETTKKELLGYLRYMYMNEETNTLNAFFSSKNFVDLVNTSTYCARLSQRTKDVLNSYSETINSIKLMKNNKENQMKNINLTKKQIEENVNYNSAQASKIENLRQKENKKYETLSQLIKNNKKEDKKLEAEMEYCKKITKKLQKELQDSTKAIEEALKKNENAKNIPKNVKSSKNHIFPVLGKSSISRGMGVYHGHNHRGIDIQTFGNPNHVVASKAGRVIIATRGSKGNQLSGYGNVVVIYHGNNETTLYAHLSSIQVSVGQIVGQGQVIGRVGNSGRTTGKTGMHLHHELKIGGKNYTPDYCKKTR